jgi:hypothetical protein
VLLTPILLAQVFNAWRQATKMLNEGEKITFINNET